MSDELGLHYKVYCLRSGAREKVQRKPVASFARYIEAEVFIHSELRGSTLRGTDSGRYWGDDGVGRSVHYWIESPQKAASVRDAEDHQPSP